MNAQHELNLALKSIPEGKRGQAIAWALNWSGDDIFELLCDALTDANFHEEVKAIKSAYINTMQLS
jgi:hypothetical protein